MLVDAKPAVAQMFNIWSMSPILFIDKSGIIQGKIAGALPGKIAVEEKPSKTIP